MVAECGNAVVGPAESHSETHSSSPGELVNCVRLITQQLLQMGFRFNDCS